MGLPPILNGINVQVEIAPHLKGRIIHGIYLSYNEKGMQYMINHSTEVFFVERER